MKNPFGDAIFRDRAILRIEIDLDPVPGACHTGEYWLEDAKYRYDVPWYHPQVSLVRVKTFPVRRFLRRFVMGIWINVRYSRPILHILKEEAW
jgi:hypothetical protein